MTFQPTDLARTFPALFFTRWITYFCAPVFFFSAGAGAFLWLSKPGRTPAALSRYLWTRGLWLIVLEVTALRFAAFFTITEGLVFLSVLWALGGSMIALAALCRIPVRILTPASLAVIALHNAFDPVRAANLGWMAPLWRVLHEPGVIVAWGVPFFPAYPLIPWIAVMSAGFCFGGVLTMEEEARRRIILRLGIAASAAFVALRFLNVYGDPAPRLTEGGGKLLLSFFNCTKYPPSLLFLLMTLGPALLLLRWLERVGPRALGPVLTIGRVPLFFFLGHFLLAHLLTFPFAAVRYGHVEFLLKPVPSMGGPAELYPPGFGYGLPMVYAIWIAVVAMMYPCCVWLSRLKRQRNDWWLSYL
jgi:uncharacterized membrane protein